MTLPEFSLVRLPFLRLSILLCLLCAALASTGCGKKKVLEPDPEFSVNVMHVPAWWPREDDKNRDWSQNPNRRNAEREVYAERGKPEYFRLVYTVDRRIVRPPELRIGRMSGALPTVELEWVYWSDQEVVSFDNSGAIMERPIGDQLKYVVLYGDPGEIKVWPEQEAERSSFTWYDHGKTLSFVEGKLVNTYEFKPMHGWGAEF